MRQTITILILTISSLTVSGQILDGGNGHALILDKQGKVWTIGKIFTFGDNPSGQQGIGNFSRCYSPKRMPLDINGIFVIDSLPISKTHSESKEPQTNMSPNQTPFNKDLILNIITYVLLLLSIILNIILYRRIKVTANCNSKPKTK
jgi:hypothetical protein